MYSLIVCSRVFLQHPTINIPNGTRARGRLMLLAFFTIGVTAFEALVVAPSASDIYLLPQSFQQEHTNQYKFQCAKLSPLKVTFVLSTVPQILKVPTSVSAIVESQFSKKMKKAKATNNSHNNFYI